MDRTTCSSSCIKLYLCSNPEDSVVERRALRENVFPKIREHCRHTQGLDLRVIDPFESSDPSHWPDENTRHELIEECRESSAGPFLLALIGHQYGTASLPIQVEVSEYQLLLQESQQMGVSTQELEREYQRDENSIPPSYCLRTTHTCSPQPHFKEQEETEKNEKKEELRKVIQTTVSRCVENSRMTPERARSYYRSALDTDLRFALENRPDGDIIGRYLVYIHRVINAKGQRLMKSKNQLLLETPTSEPGTAPSDEQLLSELCDIFLPELISSSQLSVYTTTTECDRRHGYTTARRRSYAESLCQQVNTDLLGLVDSTKVFQTSEDFLQCDALAREQAEQEELCETMSRLYDITRQETEKVRAYVEESKPQHPLVVTGGPCTGKTVLLAHCAQNIKSWLPHSDPMVIIHFCNLSTNISPKHLLSSLCYQIAAKYENRSHSESKRDPEDSSCEQNTDFMSPHHESTPEEQTCDQDLSTSACLDLYGIITPDICLFDLKRRFLSLVSLMPSTKQPLILILVGLDRIENNFGLEIIKSLLQPVHPRTKFIFSISLNSTQILQAPSQERSPSLSTSEHAEKESGYVCVKLGPVDRKECSKMLTSLLTRSGRRVTSGQQVLVNQALVSCCLTLYTRLLREHTSLWHSDSDVTESSLPDSVHSSISALLDHLEEKHGLSIVARALSYLTLSRTGLTEAELADLLSSDDTVQSVYTQQHSSRVLQIDLERLLLDLKKFLLRRTVAGSKVLFWVSRHFKLVAARKYIWSPELKREIHLVMVDYFGGQWFCGSSKEMTFKQKTDTNKVGSFLDKQQTSQPFIFSSGQVNLRKVFELPHHLQESNKWEELESMLLSLGFHQAMIQAGLLRDLVTMLENEQGSHHFYFSKERAILASVLKLNACLLQSSPLQLPTLMESSLVPYLEVFPALKCYVTEIREDRKEKGSGLGVVLCPAPSSVPSVHCSRCDAITEGVSVTGAAGTECGVVVGVTDDGTAWVWKGAGCEEVKLSLRSEQEGVSFTGVKSSGQFVLLLTSCSKLFFWDVTGSQVFLSVENPLTTTSGHQKTNNLKGFVASQRKLFMWWEEEDFVSVFDISSDTMTHIQCPGFVTCLVCSSDGVYVYCGQEDGKVSIFDTTNSCLLGTCSNSKNNTLVSIILCEAKMELACVDRTGNVTLWGVVAKFESPKLIKEVLNGGEPNNILNTDYSDRDNTLLVCHPHQVTLWDTCDWELWDQFKAPQGRAFTQALLSQDSHLFLALLEDCPLVLVWRLSTGDCVLSLETNTQPHFLLRTASDVVCVADDCCFTTWDSVMIEAAGTLPKMSFVVEEVATGGTMEFFYTTDGSEVVWRWRSKTKLPHAFFFHDNPVQKLRLSPDSAHLVTLSGGEIYIWQTETGQNILRIGGSRAADILITPNSLLGVSISDSYLSRVWKLSHGSIVCSINLYLSEAQVSPENTFLIGLHRGDLLAASLWTGSISKRFSCVMSSEHVVAFSTLSEHPDFVVVMTTSGGVYTWKVAEETVCSHFQLPNTFQCQPQDFQMSTDGSYALLSTENDVLNLLDLSQVRLCSVKAEGPVIKACLDQTGSYVVYISHPRSQEKSCVCSLHVKPVLTVVRLVDGEKIGSVFLQKMPSFLAVFKRQFAFVGFEDGSVGVYSIGDVIINEGFSTPFGCRENVKGSMKRCPFNRAPFSWLPLATPNIKWT